jgi:hypothetical protein
MQYPGVLSLKHRWAELEIIHENYLSKELWHNFFL